ncbi:hypothetical protein [Parendozoicomonas sp. Alg238-R29]|uniref:hypothetical protein n=1 Tax=Parendozoicomonas sp. Alg238-R29 TaxID=2993446 RepID=UPI00248EFC8E|nr:hypothetical protein [Parendozoicomonas sp. Alg238-R29]
MNKVAYSCRGISRNQSKALSPEDENLQQIRACRDKSEKLLIGRHQEVRMVPTKSQSQMSIVKSLGKACLSLVGFGAVGAAFALTAPWLYTVPVIKKLLPLGTLSNSAGRFRDLGGLSFYKKLTGCVLVNCYLLIQSAKWVNSKTSRVFGPTDLELRISWKEKMVAQLEEKLKTLENIELQGMAGTRIAGDMANKLIEKGKLYGERLQETT